MENDGKILNFICETSSKKPSLNEFISPPPERQSIVETSNQQFRSSSLKDQTDVPHSLQKNDKPILITSSLETSSNLQTKIPVPAPAGVFQ